ncbi:MAG TPA: hypothetical protein VHO48_13085, partial [Anaerolineaceae bacterium]|nr:hypothetical protein [Anaerolineaceae bacterium]
MTIRLTAALILLALLAGCAPQTPAAPTIDPTALFQSAMLTATYSVPSATPTLAPTTTSTPVPPTATPVRTPPALPAVFTTGLLNSKDIPHTYIEDSCQFLKNRWDPSKSEPGTVVMPIMFHSIIKGEVVKDNQINAETMRQLMHDLLDQGFETITAAQLADFMETNAKIPKRSMILIVDDRHYAEYFYDHFVPFLSQKAGSTVTNAWI